MRSTTKPLRRAGVRTAAVALVATTLVVAGPLAAHAAEMPLKLYTTSGQPLAGDQAWEASFSPSTTYVEGESPAVLGDTINYAIVDAWAFLVPQGEDPRDTTQWADSVKLSVTAISTPVTRAVQYVRSIPALVNWVDASIKSAGGAYDLGVVFTTRTNPPVVHPDIPDVWLTTIDIATDGSGTWTPRVETPEPTTPEAPAAPTVTPDRTSLTVSWTAPANGGAEITGYTVRVFPAGGDTAVATQSATTSPFTVTGLDAGTAYDVTVSATNSAGEGPESARTTATTLEPLEPGEGERDVIFGVPETQVDGELILDVPAGAANLGTAVQKPDNSFETSGELGLLAVDDQRAVSKPGWNLTAQISDFTKGAETEPVAGSKAWLGWSPRLAEGTTATGVSLGESQDAGSGTGVWNFASAPAGSGDGVTNLDATLTVKAPAGTAQGTYTAHVALTLVGA